MLLREGHDLLVKAGGRQGRGRVVRVVDPHDLRPLRHLGRDGLQVGKEAIVAAQRHEVGLAAGEPRQRGVNRIARVRAEDDVARVDESEREMRDGFLEPDGADDLFLRVDRHAEPRPHEGSGGFSEVFQAHVRRVPMRGGVVGRRAERLDDVRRRREIGIPDPQVDEILPLLPLLVLERIDPREQVGRQLSDAVGELDLHGSFSITANQFDDRGPQRPPTGIVALMSAELRKKNSFDPDLQAEPNLPSYGAGRSGTRPRRDSSGGVAGVCGPQR